MGNAIKLRFFISVFPCSARGLVQPHYCCECLVGSRLCLFVANFVKQVEFFR